MEASDARWAQLIDDAMACSDTAGDALWQKLADQLIPIIGEGGFSSLYVRSVYLTRASFDYLPYCGASDASEAMLAQLTLCLQGRDALEARAVSRLLLLKFITILASLIGISLMTGIIHSAWDCGTCDRQGVLK
jgi:hypothetical protein